MNLSDFDYPLPKELIAQHPLEKRDSSRLMVVDRKTGRIEDRVFSDILNYIQPGDALVWNDTKVFRARVLGRKKETGGKVDALFLEEADAGRWKVLLQPSLKEGQVLEFPGGKEAMFAGRASDGIALLEFREAFDVKSWLSREGSMPLPPYIKRDSGASDDQTYQTVYASKEGAVAAPTAGLHFTPGLIENIRNKGAQTLSVTLHVGYGTFKPVDDLENHRMHAEYFELSEACAEAVRQTKASGHSVWAVGTTSLRVLETCVVRKTLVAGKGLTDLYIKAPFPFEVVDKLITNFHLPKTTLLLLISAFMGEALRKKAYEHAVREKYRFYSYGDAMVIL